MPATNAFLGVLARAASIVSGLALVSPSSLALLGGGGGGGSGLPGGASAGLRGAVLSRARGRAEAAASARRGGPRSSVADATSSPQAVDQEAVALLMSPPLTFSFRLGVALGSGSSGVTGGSLGRESSRLPSTPHLDDSSSPRDAATVDAESSWWLAAMRHGYHVASAASRGGGRRGSDGDSSAAASPQAPQHAWPAIPFSEPPVPGLASSVTAVDAEGRSVASLPLPSSFGASLQQPSLSSVIELHLPDCGLTRLDGIGLTECTALRVLDVSFNTLTSLQVGAG